MRLDEERTFSALADRYLPQHRINMVAHVLLGSEPPYLQSQLFGDVAVAERPGASYRNPRFTGNQFRPVESYLSGVPIPQKANRSASEALFSSESWHSTVFTNTSS